MWPLRTHWFHLCALNGNSGDGLEPSLCWERRAPDMCDPFSANVLAKLRWSRGEVASKGTPLDGVPIGQKKLEFVVDG